MKYKKGTNTLVESIAGINKMIASRKEQLRQMAQFLEDPYNSDREFPYRSIYKRGPKLIKEIDKLVLIRLDLWRIIRNT